MSKPVLFQTIQFSISMQFSCILPIERTLSDATTPGQSEPGNDGNEEVLRVPQRSSITGTSPSDCLVSYPGYSLGRGSYPSAEVQSVYSGQNDLGSIYQFLEGGPWGAMNYVFNV